MGISRASPITFRPVGVTDSLDGTNSFPGSMSKLQNLILAYHTPGVFVPRPAGVTAASLTSINADGVVNALVNVGNRVYGMVESTTYAGKDQPFCYDFSLSGFVPIANLSSGLLPASPSRTGDWVPPVMSAVTNSLIMVTHPGYTGIGGSPVLGWIDLSGFTSSTMKANTTSGSNVLTGVVTTVGSSAPILQGVQNGQAISGTGIPAGAYVTGSTNGTFSLNTTGNTHSSTLLDGLASTTGVIAGTLVSGPGIPVGTYVTVVNSSVSVTLSQAATATASGIAVNFAGNGTITISANATGTNSNVALTVTGGTSGAPRWGAGNLNTNPLTAVPSCCAGFSGRAYLGVGPYLVYSDPLNPLQVSSGTQALVIGDPTPITALASVPLSSALTGGVQQSLTVFKGAGALTQITGDALTGNLAQNTVAGSVGTLAPNTIAQTPIGTAFMAIDGLRILGLTGVVSDTIGSDGSGVQAPFLNALYPSRMCAAYAEGIYRITVQNAADPSQPFYEYWVNLKSGNAEWTGPHTCAARQVTEYPSGGAFLIAPLAANSVLWKSDVLPRSDSIYTENGAALTWDYTTSLLPDNQQSTYNKVVQSSITAQAKTSDTLVASVADDAGTTLASCAVQGATGVASYWGAFKWGTGVWGGGASSLRELPLKWPLPLVFRQAKLTVTGTSGNGQAIGNFYAKVQPVNVNVPLK